MTRRRARFRLLHAIPVPHDSTPANETAKTCRSWFLLNGVTEALAVVRTTGRPVTHMKLDVLSVLQPNATVSPSEPGLLGDAEPKDEALGSGFASLFAQLTPPAAPGMPGQTLATLDDLESPETALDSSKPPDNTPLEMIVPAWMPMAPALLAPTLGVGNPISPGTTPSPPAWLPVLGEAPSLDGPGVSEPGAGLKSTWLTEGRMQLITPAVPSADTGTDSLMSFAQGQGLDDAALMRLFGDEFKPDASAMAKAGVVSAAAWIAGGQRHAGLHNAVVDAEATEPLELHDRLAVERAALGLLPVKRLDQAWSKAPSAEAADQTLSTGEDGRLELDLDLSALIAELAPDADLKALKAEERVALALRLGEMLAQRLVAQVQRGQWQLRFALNPQHLGRVEIDMQMRGGELEATLGALNPATRELLQDALPRLREMLQQSGMDDASLNIGSGGASKNGGQPTPQAVDADLRARPTGADNAQADATTPQGRVQRADGWDIWV